SDPKWVHNDYSTSNEGEKTEVGADDVADVADSADHPEEFSSQPESETNQGEKAEITPLNNDDRTTEQAADSSQDSEPDHSLTPEPETGTMLEMLLLIREISRNIQCFVDISQLILDSNQRIQASNLKTEKAQRK
ncbi:hypothetical protein AXA88_27575, partial [Salmonella enterica]|nr:hypothetical protein [Salmonella enterica]EAX3609567.1 hypothetical protein [Salmonella enterica]EGW6283122.1 hypothetical protein [Salmonella enterica]EGX3935533.1 hypothetical protein [Salmonella enterica]